MVVIYCIESKDGRRYIGSTKDFDHRKCEHLNDLRKEVHHNQYLQRYFNKYGEDSLTFSILRDDIDDSARSQVELEYILQFQSNNPEFGFNLTSNTSVFATFHFEKSIEKMRQSNLGKKQSPEHIEKRKQSRKGYRLPEEAKEKISRANSGKKRSPEARERNRQSHLGRKPSDQTREKMRKNHAGGRKKPAG